MIYTFSSICSCAVFLKKIKKEEKDLTDLKRDRETLIKPLLEIINKLGWKKLEGYAENYYANPHEGYICSVQRGGTGKLKPIGCGVKPNKEGYINVKLKDSDGKFRSKRVNRLILQAYNPCPGKGYVSHHINHNKVDNRLVNLEWVTYKENSRRRKDNENKHD